MLAKGTNLVCAAVVLFIAVTGSNAVMCYNCTSFLDPNCADPFNPLSLQTIDCSLEPVPENLKHMGIESATFCRKTNQKVDGQVRIIRGCGYIAHDLDNPECMKRSGTHGVNVMYCACTKDLCNGSEKLLSKHQIVFSILVAIVGSYVYQFIQVLGIIC